MVPWESRLVWRGCVNFVPVLCPEGRSQLNVSAEWTVGAGWARSI